MVGSLVSFENVLFLCNKVLAKDIARYGLLLTLFTLRHLPCTGLHRSQQSLGNRYTRGSDRLSWCAYWIGGVDRDRRLQGTEIRAENRLGRNHWSNHKFCNRWRTDSSYLGRRLGRRDNCSREVVRFRYLLHAFQPSSWNARWISYWWALRIKFLCCNPNFMPSY